MFFNFLIYLVDVFIVNYLEMLLISMKSTSMR